RGCYAGFLGLPANDGMWSQWSGSVNPEYPDSVRFGLESMSQCYALPITSANCSPTTGANAGGPFDDLAIGFARSPAKPGLIASPWDLFNDSFPDNVSAFPVESFQFDTCAARIQTGHNLYGATGLTGASGRLNVPGDSMIVSAGGTNTRVDFVF